MSVPYHVELVNNESFRLMMNIAKVKNDTPDENLELVFYAIDSNGIPIFNESFNVDIARKIYGQLATISVISEGSSKSNRIIEVTDIINTLVEKLEEEDIDTITMLLEKFESDTKVKSLLSSLSDLEIKNLHGAYFHKFMQEELSNLFYLIENEKNNTLKSIDTIDSLKKYKAGQPEKIFQNWIEENLWIFGVEYIRKYDVRKIALASEADLLMESSDGFLDLIELKRPKHKIFKYDVSHKSYYPHSDLAAALGQCLLYLKKLEEYKHIIEKEYKFKVIMPRVKLIIGNSNEFSDEEFDALRVLNMSLSNIEIITYNELLHNGEILLNKTENSKIEVVE